MLRSGDLLRKRSAPAQQHHPRDVLELRASLRRNQITTQQKDAPARAAAIRSEPQLTSVNERFKRTLEILQIRRRLFIDDDLIPDYMFHSPVFLRPQPLP